MAVRLNIESWVPRTEKKWTFDPDGSISAAIYIWYFGVVEVFTFPGNERCGEFTTLETFRGQHVYRARLGRFYNHRWLRRLAGAFASQVAELEKAR